MAIQPVYEDLCQRTHQNLLAGTCPWCGKSIVDGQLVMEVSRRHAEEACLISQFGLKKLGDGWFAEQLAAAQDGDPVAHTLLASSCTSLMAQTVSRWIARFPEVDLQRALNEATFGVSNAIRDFDGNSADEFLSFAAACIRRHLDRSFRKKK